MYAFIYYYYYYGYYYILQNKLIGLWAPSLGVLHKCTFSFHSNVISLSYNYSYCVCRLDGAALHCAILYYIKTIKLNREACQNHSFAGETENEHTQNVWCNP